MKQLPREANDLTIVWSDGTRWTIAIPKVWAGGDAPLPTAKRFELSEPYPLPADECFVYREKDSE